MKVIFISNYLTHHQLPFCEEMAKRLGDDFAFLATNPMEEERIRMGWGLDLSEVPYAYFYDDDMDHYHQQLLDADVVICGGTHHSYIQDRLEQGKLTFRYFERLYKKGRLHAFTPKGYPAKWREHTRYRKSPVFLLCAGAYVAGDFELFFSYPGKKLKWGYFPELKQYDDSLWEQKNPKEILWTGRMIDWKHPEMAVKVAANLKKAGIDFHLTMVGEGDRKKAVLALIQENGLEQQITVMDFMEPEKVRHQMEQSSIYLMTSDNQEGWGAVVNEAMNSGCAVVASRQAGAGPYLITNGENGFLYSCSREKEMTELVKRLLLDHELCERLGRMAYRTIRDSWNAGVAAERFLEFCENQLEGRMKIYDKDVLSRAD